MHNRYDILLFFCTMTVSELADLRVINERYPVEGTDLAVRIDLGSFEKQLLGQNAVLRGRRADGFNVTRLNI